MFVNYKCPLLLYDISLFIAGQYHIFTKWPPLSTAVSQVICFLTSNLIWQLFPNHYSQPPNSSRGQFNQPLHVSWYPNDPICGSALCNVPLHHAAVPWRGKLSSGPPGPSIRFSGQTLGMHQYLYDTIYLLSPVGFIIICLVPISRIIPLRAIVS